jgi:hypothetical protein
MMPLLLKLLHNPDENLDPRASKVKLTPLRVSGALIPEVDQSILVEPKE